MGERENKIFQAVQGVVTYGPFKGLKLANRAVWGNGDMCSKYLGFYEYILHDAIQRVIDHSKVDVIINVGCGDGVYALGLSQRFPEARVICYDTNPHVYHILKENAEMNSLKVPEFYTSCSIEHLTGILEEENDRNIFVFSDCEGYEYNIFDPNRIPQLLKNNIRYIIECHDFCNPDITPLLTSRFQATHNIEIIKEQPRTMDDYNKNELVPTLGLSEADLHDVLNEHRPCYMHWMYVCPKGARTAMMLRSLSGAGTQCEHSGRVCH